MHSWSGERRMQLRYTSTRRRAGMYHVGYANRGVFGDYSKDAVTAALFLEPDTVPHNSQLQV